MKQGVLVIATKKNFWASEESSVFTDRVHTWILWGYSEDRFNTLILVVRALILLWVRRPEVVIVGQAARAALWFSYLIKLHVVPQAKWIAIDPVYLHDRHACVYDRVLVYCRNQLRGNHKFHFRYIPLPANGFFSECRTERKPYFVSIGIAYRDFGSLVRAATISRFPVILVTKSPETLGDIGVLPPHVEVRYSIPIQECVQLVAESRGVIVPLLEGEIPHGHSAVVQALRLGKAVISTRRSTVDDYITDGIEGLLVEPGDVEGYAGAMKRLWSDEALLESMEKKARERSQEFSYAYFAEALQREVEAVIREGIKK